MQISAKMNKALNDQIAHELDASHRYLAMTYAFDAMGLKIFGKHFAKQAAEERDHAMKIAQYIHDVNGHVVIDAIDKPRNNYKNAREIVEAALESEITVTKQIHSLAALADKESDYATRNFLEWFIEEQVEEVDSMRELIQWIEMSGERNLLQVESRLMQIQS